MKKNQTKSRKPSPEGTDKTSTLPASRKTPEPPIRSGSSLRRTMSWKHYGLILLLLCGVTLISYVNSLPNPFIWDDTFLIERNAYVAGTGSLAGIFSTSIMQGAGKEESQFYRPLQILDYRLERNLWGLSAWGYHVTAILLHFLNGLLVFHLMMRLRVGVGVGVGISGAILTAVLFLVHPIQTESVTYLSSRSELLMLFFYLLTLLLVRRSLESGQWGWYGLSLLTLLCSLLSKEMAATVPVVLCLLSVISSRDRSDMVRGCLAALPHLVVVVVFVVLRLLYLHLTPSELVTAGDLPANYGNDLVVRLVAFSVILSRYVVLLFLPMTLTMERSLGSELFFFDPDVLVPMFTVTVALVLWFTRPHLRRYLWGLVWFLVTLLPVSGIIPINYTMAERYLYLPSIGFFAFLIIVFSDGSQWASQRWSPRINGVAVRLAAFVCVLLCVRTILRNADWRDPVIFYEKTIVSGGDSSRIRNNLATELGKRGRFRDAIDQLEIALERHPDYIDPLNNCAYAWFNLGEDERALELLSRVVALGGEPHNFWRAIVRRHIETGREDAALDIFRRLSTPPARAFLNCALVYYELGDKVRAEGLMLKALEIQPTLAEARVSLGSIYAEQGRYDLARKEWEESLRINPRLLEARACLDRLRSRGK